FDLASPDLQRQIQQAKAEDAGIELIENLGPIAPELAALLPLELARKHRAIPARKDGAPLVLAIPDPFDPHLIDAIQGALRQVDFVIAPGEQIDAARRLHYGVSPDGTSTEPATCHVLAGLRREISATAGRPMILLRERGEPAREFAS